MHKILDSREQLRTVSLDEFVDYDSPVRILDVIIDEVISRYKIPLPTGSNRYGRRAYSAKDLVKLYIYGYINGITSCRTLEKAANINIELIWLIKGQKPSYKTISDFRKNSPSFIQEVFQKSIVLLMDEKLIGNHTWVLDGHKVKGNAKRDMLSINKLRQNVQETESQIELLMKELEAEQSSSNQEAVSSLTENKDKLSSLIESQDNIQSLIDAADSKGQSYISPSDQDALLLKTRRGKCAGFNTQVVVDDTNHLIVGAELADVCVDNTSLYSTIKSTSDATGAKPQMILADRGYTNYQDIRKIYEEITDGVRVMLQKSPRDKSSLEFKYDPDNNQVICPQGNIMKYRRKRLDKGVIYSVYKCNLCGSCPIKTKCTKSQKSRLYHISENHDFIKMYKGLMQKEESIKATKRRKSVVEHVFGTLDHMMHYNGFKLRGRLKVMTELYLYSISYNMKRLFKLFKSPHPIGFLGKLCLRAIKDVLSSIYSFILELQELIMGQFPIKIRLITRFFFS